MAGKSALVVGVTGMVGRPLAEALKQDGWDVTGICRFRQADQRQALESAGVGTIAFDITRDDPAVLPDVDVLFLEVWDPDTWAADQIDFVWQINYYAVGRVVERYAGAADVVNGCTINVYGDGPDPPNETAPCRPTSVYGRARFAQERLIDYFCYRGGRSGIHVRYAHANSPAKGVVRKWAEMISRGESLGANPDARTQIIALEDFVRVTRLAAGRVANPPVAVNCCSTRIWTQRELAEEIHRRLGRGEVVFDRDHGGAESSAYADPARMVDWFGLPQVPVETVIERAVADFLNSDPHTG